MKNGGETTAALYYTIPYLRAVHAKVTDVWGDSSDQHGPCLAVVLDRTILYPGGGGQPCDLGQINGRRVLGVVTRSDKSSREGSSQNGNRDQSIVHLLPDDGSSIEVGEQVLVELDWGRRFDHMQQHTAQHILSRSLVEVGGLETVSFHLGASDVTIDVDSGTVAADILQKAEDLANRVVWQDLPIGVKVVSSPAGADGLPLRRRPGVEGEWRLIEIGGFDLNACSGTHLTSTGQVGIIKVLGTERRGTETRVHFLAGGRALDDWQAKERVLAALRQQLSAGVGELATMTAKAVADNKALYKRVRGLERALAVARAPELARRAVRAWPVDAEGTRGNQVELIVTLVEDIPADELITIANLLKGEDRVLFLAAPVNGRGESDTELRVIVTVGEGARPQLSAGELLKRVLGPWGSRGGGSGEQAQGGGVPCGDWPEVSNRIKEFFQLRCE